MNRQKVLLLVLVAVLVLAVIYAFLRMPEQKTVGKLKNVPGGPVEARKGVLVKTTLKKVNLELLDKPMPRFSGFKRNIFWLRPYETVKKLPPPPPPPQPLPPPPPPPSAEELLSQAVRAELAKFTFLGFLLKDNRRTVFLSKDKEIFVVKKGERIANKYEVSAISDEDLTLSSTSGHGQIIIPLIENMPLKTRIK